MNPQNNCLLTTDASVYNGIAFVLRNKAGASAPDTAGAQRRACRGAGAPVSPVRSVCRPATGPRRWYERIHMADAYDVLLISWLPGQATGFHDHGRSAG